MGKCFSCSNVDTIVHRNVVLLNFRIISLFSALAVAVAFPFKSIACKSTVIDVSIILHNIANVNNVLFLSLSLSLSYIPMLFPLILILFFASTSYFVSIFEVLNNKGNKCDTQQRSWMRYFRKECVCVYLVSEEKRRMATKKIGLSYYQRIIGYKKNCERIRG